MKNIEIFSHENLGQVRVMNLDNEPWFIGKDVAETLGYSNTRKALKDHVDEEDKGVTKCDTLGGSQEMIIINESGLYSLLLLSKTQKAKQFKRWITHEVIPSIRKTGVYAASHVDSSLMYKIAQELERKEQQIEQLKPKALFADAVSASHTSILVGDLAKILRQNGYHTGQNRLFEILREDGFLIKSGFAKNMPTQRAMEMGLFEVKESTLSNPDGSVRITRTTKVTGKGQCYFVNYFLNGENKTIPPEKRITFLSAIAGIKKPSYSKY